MVWEPLIDQGKVWRYAISSIAPRATIVPSNGAAMHTCATGADEGRIPRLNACEQAQREMVAHHPVTNGRRSGLRQAAASSVSL